MTESEALRRTLDRHQLPGDFERWRVTLEPGEGRATGAAEWAGALVLIERGRLEVKCLEGGCESFRAGDLLTLGWLPLRELRNPGSVTMSLVAIRRRGARPSLEPFLRVERLARARAREKGDQMPSDTPSRRSGPKSPPPASIDAYLAAVPANQRAALEELRRVIRAAVPAATEVISYSAPAFRHHGMLVSFTAARDHCTFHLMGTDLLPRFAPELEGYTLTKGGIHFTPDRPIPAELVTRMVRAKAAQNEARAADRTGGR